MRRLNNHRRVIKAVNFTPFSSFKSVISNFRRDVDEMCALLGYAVSNGNPLPMFQDDVSVT
jgi:hypothetical protein